MFFEVNRTFKAVRPSWINSMPLKSAIGGKVIHLPILESQNKQPLNIPVCAIGPFMSGLSRIFGSSRTQ